MMVLLDTNFLLLPFQRKVDVFEEIARIADGKIGFAVMQGSVDELKAMGGKQALGARAALELARFKGAQVIPGTGRPDAQILSFARSRKSGDFAVATEDRGLRRKLSAAGVRIIGMRGRSAAFV